MSRGPGRVVKPRRGPVLAAVSAAIIGGLALSGLALPAGVSAQVNAQPPEVAQNPPAPPAPPSPPMPAASPTTVPVVAPSGGGGAAAAPAAVPAYGPYGQKPVGPAVKVPVAPAGQKPVAPVIQKAAVPAVKPVVRVAQKPAVVVQRRYVAPAVRVVPVYVTPTYVVRPTVAVAAAPSYAMPATGTGGVTTGNSSPWLPAGVSVGFAGLALAGAGALRKRTSS